MTIRVHLFARARDLAGLPTIMVKLSEGSRVADLRLQLATQHPALATLLSTSAIAIDHDFAEDTRPLTGNEEVALIPPVSGG